MHLPTEIDISVYVMSVSSCSLFNQIENCGTIRKIMTGVGNTAAFTEKGRNFCRSHVSIFLVLFNGTKNFGGVGKSCFTD
jgi:hypothetical protein